MKIGELICIDCFTHEETVKLRLYDRDENNIEDESFNKAFTRMIARTVIQLPPREWKKCKCREVRFVPGQRSIYMDMFESFISQNSLMSSHWRWRVHDKST